MSKITSPFNFVPLSDLVFYPQWGDMVSHDIPFEDGEDGVIELEITNKSPLFIGEDNSDHFSAHVLSEDRRHYYIPGTTLKGCFRNVMEVLSYGKMEQYEDDSFGFRTFDTKVRNDYQKLVRNVRCGWMWKDYDKCYIEECVNGIQRIRHLDLIRKFGLKAELTDEEAENMNATYPVIEVRENEYSFRKNNQLVFVKEGKYNVVCTGQIKGKNHEYLFSFECKDRIEVAPRVVERFETVHKSTPAFEIRKDRKGYIRENYDNGKKIPVFFIKDETGVTCVGLTMMMKYPYKYSIKDLVKKNYVSEVWSEFDRKRDLPQCVFGSIGNTSLKGRVQIGNAFMDAEVRDEDLQLVSGVLGQPKSSYYPLYLKQDGKSVVNYSTTQSTIAGRKRYRVTKDFQTIPLTKGENEKVISRLNVLPRGLTFKCLIGLHNMRKVEIGALLSSITFNETGGCYHNVGMAKAFGYGIIECRIKGLRGLQHSVSEYVASFDEAMSCFLHENGRRLSSEDAYKQLASIASPTHGPDVMKQMEFDECRLYTQDLNASLLVEEPKAFNFNIDEDEAFANELKRYVDEECRRAGYLVAENRLRDAIDMLNDLVLKLAKDNFDSSAVKVLIEEYQEKEKIYIKEQEERERLELEIQNDLRKQKELADIKAAKDARIEKGLSFLLDTKVNSSELKIASLPQGVSRIKDFLKKNHSYVISSDDYESVHAWLCSLDIPKKKQEKKEFQDMESQSWKYISSLFGDAGKWFEEVNANCAPK